MHKPDFDSMFSPRDMAVYQGNICFLGMSSPKAPPVIPAPVVMPTENTAAVTAAQQSELQATAMRSGRASTILTQNDIGKTDTMGG